jgi:hypothetical protein
MRPASSCGAGPSSSLTDAAANRVRALAGRPALFDATANFVQLIAGAVRSHQHSLSRCNNRPQSGWPPDAGPKSRACDRDSRFDPMPSQEVEMTGGWTRSSTPTTSDMSSPPQKKILDPAGSHDRRSARSTYRRRHRRWVL